MKKLRYSLAVVALLATLGGFSLHASSSMANAASSHHASSTFAAGHTTRSIAIKRYGPSPVLGTDC